MMEKNQIIEEIDATVKVLVEKAKTAIDERDERIKELEEKIVAYDEALAKIHDLAGQVRGSDFVNSHMGAIQDWVHQVSPCPKRRCEAEWTGERCVKEADHKGRHRGEEDSEWA